MNSNKEPSERNEFKENTDIRAFLKESERLMTEVQNLRDKLFYHQRTITELETENEELKDQINVQK